MARITYVWCPESGAVVPKGDAAPRQGGVTIIPDISETVHPCDGRTYSSRRRYDDVTRAHGCIEIGRTEQRKMMERGNRPVLTGPSVAESLRATIQRTT